MIIEIAIQNKTEFPDDFMEWLPDNLHVVHQFNNETFKIIAKGFKHYSGRTILEVLRHHSALSENAKPYKLNNNHTPYLCRLFGLLFPQHANLFEYRITHKPLRRLELDHI
jgi:hypothetical protein